MDDEGEWRPWRPIVWTYRGWAARLPNNYQGVQEQAIRALLAAGEQPAYTPTDHRRFWQIWKPSNRSRAGFVVHSHGEKVTVHYQEAFEAQLDRTTARARYTGALKNAGYQIDPPTASGDDERDDPRIEATARRIHPLRHARWRRRPVP